jgi:hypothetical protein
LKNKHIIFTDVTDGLGVTLKPVPSSEMIPQWYKDTGSYVGGKKLPPLTAGLSPEGPGGNVGTVKRCMPFFDAMTAGYLLLTPADLYISKDENGDILYEWASYDMISFHPIDQAPIYPYNPTRGKFPKFINPWAIKTPEGYSTYFTTPIHQDLPFVSMEAIVDTDRYTAPVNIIFTLKDSNFEGTIPRGTPFVQVIPFKRENWEMKIGDEKDFQEQSKITRQLSTKFFDKYKTMFRAKKEYK